MGLRRARSPFCRALVLGLLPFAVLSGACDDDPPPRTDPPAEPPVESHGEPPPATEENTASPQNTESSSENDGSGEENTAVDPEEAAPSEGCAATGSVRIDGAPGWPAIAPIADRGFLIAAYTGEGAGERLLLARVGADRSVAILHRLPTGGAGASARLTPPALATLGERGVVVTRSATGGVQAALLSGIAGAPPAPRFVSVGEAADGRFAPAAIPIREGRFRVAFTDGSSTPLRVRVVDFDGAAANRYEILPPGGGAAAPFFEAGQPDHLFFIDPRAALSVVHRAELTSNGPGAIEPAQALSMAAPRPTFAIAAIGEQRWVAFTVVGELASAAVGLARAGSAQPPRALVPGQGWGTLHVDGVTSNDRAIFVAEAFREAAREGPRELRLRWVEGAEGALSEPVTLAGPGGQGERPRLAVAPDGTIAVAFSAPEGLFLSWLRYAAP